MDFVTATTTIEKYKTIVKSDNHQIIADEPLDLGGMDLGFNPGELLCASLASCTSITLRMYIDRKKWDMQKIEVGVDFNREDKNNPFLVRTVTVFGNIDDEQFKRLLSIANACPVHKLLEKGIKIETTLTIHS